MVETVRCSQQVRAKLAAPRHRVYRDAEQLASEAREHEKRGGPTTRARMQLQKKCASFRLLRFSTSFRVRAVEHVRQDVSQLNKSLNSIAEDPMRYRM